MIKETGERNLEAAISLYQQAIDAAANSNPLLVSKARYRMGTCYERLGNIPEAETLYQQIVTDSAHNPGEISELAHDSLQRIENERRKEQAAAAAAIPHLVKTATVYEPTQARLLLGPTFIENHDGMGTRFAVGLSYPLFKKVDEPPFLWVDLGAITPLGDLTIDRAIQTPDAQTADVGQLNFQYQVHLSLMTELPHGLERDLIPEIGAGLALTHSSIDWTRVTTGPSPSRQTGSDSSSHWGPYFATGLQFYPDHILSAALEASYSNAAFSKSVQIPTAPGGHAFNFSNSFWNITAALRVRLGWYKKVVEPI